MSLVADTKAVLNLIEHPLRTPEYLRPALNQLKDIAGAMAEALGDFLGSEAHSAMVEAQRMMSMPPYEDSGVHFDCLPIDDHPALRLSFSEETIGHVVEAIFGGEVTDPTLQRSVGEALATKLAELIASVDPNTFEVPSVQACGKKPLDSRPVIRLRYEIATRNFGNLAIGLEVSRTFTDRLAAPQPALPPCVVDNVRFTGLAQLVAFKSSVRKVAAWGPGDVIPLPGARLDGVRLVVQTPRKSFAVAEGDLGAEGGKRCVKLNLVAPPGSELAAIPDGQEQGDHPAAAAAASDFGFDGGTGEEFAAPDPALPDDFGTAAEGEEDFSMPMDDLPEFDMATPMDDMGDFDTDGAGEDDDTEAA